MGTDIIKIVTVENIVINLTSGSQFKHRCLLELLTNPEKAAEAVAIIKEELAR